MKFEVQVLSREAIKPSSPTPSHLRHYQLSFLDQISPPSFIPLVFFYPKQTNDKLSQTEKSNQLKNHLSQVLTRFYPLAGRVRESTDNLYVDCNHDGVPYVEAAITDCKLSEFISDPIPEELNKWQPCQLDDVTDGLPMAIQVNFFDCGGIAIFVAISHKLADGLSVIVFVNSWASIARGDDNVPPPHLDAASLFPPKKLDGFMPSSGIIKDRIITKRFLFTASKIAALRDKCSDDTSHTTRIDALSTFLWSRFTASIVEKRDPKKIYAIF
ncbi:shikimate O-hydroxycinnamoyltransferase [Sarracenia purpurea var. burkii]